MSVMSPALASGFFTNIKVIMGAKNEKFNIKLGKLTKKTSLKLKKEDKEMYGRKDKTERIHSGKSIVTSGNRARENNKKLRYNITKTNLVMGNFPDMKSLTLYMEGDCHIFSKISEKRLIPKYII